MPIVRVGLLSPMGSSLEIFHAGWPADVGPVEV
jgi:hypothetical protein